jgi:hypothetical protein
VIRASPCEYEVAEETRDDMRRSGMVGSPWMRYCRCIKRDKCNKECEKLELQQQTLFDW